MVKEEGGGVQWGAEGAEVDEEGCRARGVLDYDARAAHNPIIRANALTFQDQPHIFFLHFWPIIRQLVGQRRERGCCMK